MLPVFICPSDRSTGLFTIYDSNGNALVQAATNSYAACQGYGPDLDDELDDGTGMFFRNSKIKFADITDGSSNTIAIGERASLLTQTPWAGAVSYGTTRVTPGAPVDDPTAVEEAPSQVLAHVDIDMLNASKLRPGGFLHASFGCRDVPFCGRHRAIHSREHSHWDSPESCHPQRR